MNTSSKYHNNVQAQAEQFRLRFLLPAFPQCREKLWKAVRKNAGFLSHNT